MKTFTLTESVVKNLVITYAVHKNQLDEADTKMEMAYESAFCAAAEGWMRALGIHPESNYVMDIINKEKKWR